MKLRRFRNVALLILLTGITQVSTAGEMGKKGILDVLHGMRSVSFEETAVQQLFGKEISNITTNGYWTFYEGQGPILDDGVAIRKFGLKKRNDATAAPHVYMDVQGACVSPDDIKKAYPDLTTRNPIPSPHSLLVGYVSENEDSKMTFAFRVESPKAPRCLVNVGFSLKKLELHSASSK